MNDLDRKIAELKGWEWDDAERMVWTEPPFETVVYGEKTEARRGLVISFCNWSRDDAKALELVDEIPECHFMLERGLSPEVDAEAWEWEWRAGFMLGGSCHLVVAPTRPEAICRAYIAAREWLKEKKG